MEKKIPYIDDITSKKVDEELMSTYQYSIDQLMEVAGLSVSTINGYDIDILYPKQNTKNELYKRLVTQCQSYDIKILNELNSDFNEYNFIIDAIFGFSFHGEIRQPFKDIIDKLNKIEDKIISVDIPSGYDINKGNINNTFNPKFLISLTLPKLCSKDFKGEHYLGGRFVPKVLFDKLNIKVEGKLYNDSKLYTKI